MIPEAAAIRPFEPADAKAVSTLVRQVFDEHVAASFEPEGIASALMARAEEASRAAGRPRMTVHSSLNAQGFYERLGFVPTDEPQMVGGFAFATMEKQLLLGKLPICPTVKGTETC